MSHTMKFLATALACSLLAGCPLPPPTEHPSITVTPGNNVLIVSGSGFAPGLANCAHLVLVGPTQTISMGNPSCSAGAFSTFAFPYSYGACGSNPNSTATFTILAQDPSSTAGTSQSVQLPWQMGCMVAPAGCLGTGTSCAACGGEGQPTCSGGVCVEPKCSYYEQQNGTCDSNLPDLHPTLVGSQLICTANCGHTQGYSPCYAYMDGCPATSSYPSTLISPQNTCVTTPAGLKTYSCYDDSTIQPSGDCTCVPSKTSCPVNSSPGDGTCHSTPC